MPNYQPPTRRQVGFIIALCALAVAVCAVAIALWVVLLSPIPTM